MSQAALQLPEAIEIRRSQINGHLKTCLSQCDVPGSLREALRYAVLGEGKRLRPTLVLLCCEAAGTDGRAALDAAAAIEFIHAFSLVHDDLPAMDDDLLRRGRETVHVRYGEAMAILTGDALVSLAFSMLVTDSFESPISAALTRELSHATSRMIAGQVHDTIGGLDESLSDRERLAAIHDRKTGALIRAACRMGGIVANADETALQHLTAYGQLIGLMYQIIDDLLDVTQSTEHLGKASGKDAAAGKLTFPGVLGIEASMQEVQSLRQRATDAIVPLADAAQPLRDLCEYLATRTN